MKTIQEFRARMRGAAGHALVGVLAALVASPGALAARTQAAAAAPDQAPKLSQDQLESLVAPIALYPDPLLAQCLAASTYPLDVVEAQQWLSQNSSLKGEALTQAAQKQNWDPSVQALVAIPDALKRLSENVKWTTDLGNAFLAQEQDVMNAVQALRAEAQKAGKLQSTEQQKVETKVVETRTYVVIEPASPTVVYVPTYSPTVIWGPPVYPYPPVYYPPYVPGAALFTFGMGIAVGAAISGGWGWGCGWGHHTTININNNNTFVRNTNINNNVNRTGNSTWQHNAQNRGGVPYKDRATANKYGGGTRGDSPATRQAQARNQSANRASQANVGGRTGEPRAGGDRAGASNMSANRGGGSGGGDRVGNRSVEPSNRGGSAFSGQQSASRAQQTSARGASSMGSRSGGAQRGGGSRR